MSIEKTTKMNALFDTYGGLLNDRQQVIFKEYYHEDLSLNEIAQEFCVSKQAISKILHRAEKELIDYEAHLRLRQKEALIDQLIAKYPADPDIKALKMGGNLLKMQ